MEGIIFNIQRFSTHDGPGVRTVVFIKGCPLRCWWCQNPESQAIAPVLMYRSDSCIGCGACEQVCPVGAAKIINGTSQIDRKKCTDCGKCAAVCKGDALSISGYSASVDEVMAEILKDRSYYLNSGGGVTLSGGEATAQSDFAIEILSRCKAKYIHTAIETCGFVQTEELKRFIPVTDLFFFDLKAIDSQKHRAGTGHGNELILKNAKMLVEAGCKVIFRMPLIPGYNDSAQDVISLREFVEKELCISCAEVELLKYNQLGEVKFERLGRSDRPSLRPQSDEYFEELKALLR